MKSRLFAGLLALFVSAAMATEGKVNVNTKVEKATVYLQGAQLYRTAAVNLRAGMNTVVFENLEANIAAGSIQVSGTGSVVIMDVWQDVKYPEQMATPGLEAKTIKQLKQLNDSLILLNFDWEELKARIEIIALQKSLLVNNRLIKGDTKRDTLNLVKEAFSYLNERLNALNIEHYKLKKDELKLLAKIETMKSRITLLQNTNVNNKMVDDNTPKYQVLVSVYAEAAAIANLGIQYYIQDAGWVLSYDLRAKSAVQAMQLIYKAQIHQSTGIDWKNVKLTLATSNPRQNNSRPVLNAWWLNFYQQYYNSAADSYMSKPSIQGQKADISEDKKKDEANSMLDYTFIEQKFYDTEYQLQLACDVPSDGEAHYIPVQTKEITASLQHFAVPKLDKDAFLIARLTEYENLNLFPGNVNIYFDGSFVGQSFINPENVNDTLDITMGRDKSISTNRIKLKEKNKEKFIADDRLRTIAYEITVRNNKNATVNLQLQDQIPISQNKDIVIESKELSSGDLEASTGIITWNLKLKPGEVKKINFSYSIKYPKDKVLAGV